MNNKIIISILIISIGLVCGNYSSQKEIDSITEKINIQLDSLLFNPAFESVSIGVIKDNKTYSIHKGKLLNGNAPSNETLYEIASITKTFTGTLLAQAIFEKKVKLDDDISQYLTDDLPNLEYENEPITFRHLVTHQSGLPNMFPNKEGLFDNPDWDKLPFEINSLQENFSKKAFFNELAKVELDTIPGLNFSYSNAGANLLGYLLEEIYNKPYEVLLQEKILAPLKMKNTAIAKSEVDINKIAYGQNSNKIKMPLRVEKAMNAEGGIVSTVPDMLNYLRFHLDEKNEIVATSHQHLWNGKYGDFDIGFFWQINKNGSNPDVIFQNGGAFGTSSWVSIIPEKDIGIFIVTNTSGANIHQKLNEIVNKIIE